MIQLNFKNISDLSFDNTHKLEINLQGQFLELFKKKLSIEKSMS